MAGAVALAYFTIAAAIVPRIQLPGATRRFVVLFRTGAVAFLVGAGLTHVHIALYALSHPHEVALHGIFFHVMQLVGVWVFIFAAATSLDVRIQKRDKPDRRKLQEFEAMALRDPLTGAYNRRFFDDALAKEIDRHHRYGKPVSVVFFDVDHFRRINDSSGHVVGDRVLCEIARVAERVVRPSDAVARFGEDELALLLPEADALRALMVAERLRSTVRHAGIDPPHRFTISAGAASCPEDATTADELAARAHQALYWAKRSGKNMCAAASEVVVLEADEDSQILAPLYALAEALDVPPMHTREHSENVAAYAAALGKALGLSADQVARLRRAAFFHDIGKLQVPREVLAKPGRLSAGEWTEMRRHPSAGQRIVRHAGLHAEASWIRHHHERIDGGGYPDGLAGDEIPLEARIIFVADAFEAMTSMRPYQDARCAAEAIDELRRCRGTQFDAAIVDTMIDLLSAGAIPVLAPSGAEQPQAT